MNEKQMTAIQHSMRCQTARTRTAAGGADAIGAPVMESS